jgi:6-phosphogluconolactonase
MQVISQGRSGTKGRLRLLLIAAAIATLVPAVVAVTSGQGKVAKRAGSKVVGAVYTETNDQSANKVVKFARKANGRLVKRAAVATGGKGSAQSVGCGPGCPILDSNYAVVNDGRLVFAVNAGSDTITSFRDGPNGFKKVDTNPSGGDMPEGIAVHDGVLYVLNVNTSNSNGTTGNIYGVTYTPTGQLTSISGSSQPLANFSPPEGTPGGAATARSIEFKPNGKVIVVTELAAGGGAGAIDTFVVGGNDKAKAVTAYPSSDGFPFGTAFNSDDTLLVTNLHAPVPGTIGSMSSYTVNNAGKVTPIDTKPTAGELPCWVAVTGDDKFAFAVNTGAGAPATVARFKLLATGSLNFRGLTPERPNEFARTDIALSNGSHYAYVMSPQVAPPTGAPPSHIDIYRVTATGGLVFVGQSAAGANLGGGATGLAAR